MSKWAKISVVLAGVAGLLIWFTYSRTREANAAQLLPPPSVIPRPARPIIESVAAATGTQSAQEIIAQFAKSGIPKLSSEQIEFFLSEKKRSPDSLLVAFRLSQDVSYLHEAVKSFPDNPAVQLEAALRSPSVTERQQGIDTFKKLLPESPLGHYLQADLAFNQGDYASAAQGVVQTLNNGNLPDFSTGLLQNTEAAFLGAGYSPIESKIAALFAFNEGRAQSLTPLQNISDNLGELRNQFIQQGDIDTADPAVQIELSLGQHIQNQVNPALLNALVGQAIERKTLETLDPATPLGPNGETVQSRLVELAVMGQEVSVLLDSLQRYPIASMSAEELNQYTQHLQQEGEIGALKWWAKQKSVLQK